MNATRGKILVIRGGAIGDFVLTVPVLVALRQNFPNATLEVLGYPHIVGLAQASGLVDRIHSIEARSLAGFFARSGDLAEDLVDYFSEFDVIISYLYDPDAIFQTNVARCSSGQFIQGPHRPDERQAEHAVQTFLKPLQRLAIFEADPVPKLSFDHGAVAERTIALHPGSGSDRKNWPEARWAELIEFLVHQSSLDLLLVGGEAEGERLQRLAAALPPARCHVAQSLPLPELGRWLERSSIFVGHDSGITHLAAAVGLPGVLLWGDTAEAIWRPPSRKMTVLRHSKGLAHIPVQEVIREVLKLI